MERVTLTFGEPRNVTLPGQDSVVYRFPFTSIDSDLIGSPEEARFIKNHQLTVEIVRSRLPAWGLSGFDLEKELFEIGSRAVVEKVKKGKLNAEEKVPINTKNQPRTPPYNPSRIVEPNGAVIVVPLERARIGF